MPTKLNHRERATILAALRHYADEHDRYDGTTDLPYYDVATALGKYVALNAEEIEELADQIAMSDVELS